MTEIPKVDVSAALNDLDEVAVLDWVDNQIAQGTPAHQITDQLAEGLDRIGARFTAGDCFIPELIGSGEIFRKALEKIKPILAASSEIVKQTDILLIGTVKGDLHDLGKNLVGMTFLTAGFEVVDLGKDVPADKFVAAVKETKPAVLGMSALLTTTMEVQKEVIELLEQEGLRQDVKVIVGGAPVNQGWADQIRADAFASDAIDGINKARTLLGIG